MFDVAQLPEIPPPPPDHTFLKYREVDVHFVCSFLWRASAPIPTSLFRSGFGGTTPSAKPSGWSAPLLHERLITRSPTEPQGEWIGAYQPTFVLARRHLEYSAAVASSEGGESRKAWVVVPLRSGVALPEATATLADEPATWNDGLVVCPVTIDSTVRLFDSGAGTITFRVCLRALDEAEAGATRFAMVHWLLRLTPNMDVEPEAHDLPEGSTSAPQWLTDSFVFISGVGTCRLFDVMNCELAQALAKFPGNVGEGGGAVTVNVDSSDLAFNSETRSDASNSTPRPLSTYTHPGWRENQVPFVFVTAVIERESFKRLIDGGSATTAKELATIYTKLTLDNRSAHADFERLSLGYLQHVLDFDSNTGRLLNLCLDDRLFFSFSRRGAIAVSAVPRDLPAVFVIPSLLNLIEILRARLLLGVRTGIRLADIAERLATLDVEADPIDEAEYSRLRSTIISNLQNPLQYLFDGGSVTEVAIAAESLLFVDEIWKNARRSFDAVDRLRTAWEAHRFRSRYGS